jgi:hypothetical protein
MFFEKTLIHRVAVIGFVANHALRGSFYKATFNGGFNQLYLVG